MFLGFLSDCFCLGSTLSMREIRKKEVCTSELSRAHFSAKRFFNSRRRNSEVILWYEGVHLSILYAAGLHYFQHPLGRGALRGVIQLLDVSPCLSAGSIWRNLWTHRSSRRADQELANLIWLFARLRHNQNRRRVSFQLLTHKQSSLATIYLAASGRVTNRPSLVRNI